jgi:DNA-binding NarL/FixJ family response regulator
VIRVILVDDEPIVRSGIALLLSGEPDIEVLADVDTGEEAVDLAVRHHPDVVIADVRMPGMDGVETTRRIVHATGEAAGDTNQFPVKVLVLTTFHVDEAVLAALRAGASGFILKDAAPTELVAAVRPLLKTRHAIEQQVDDLDRKVRKLAPYDAQVRRFMTAPGVGPITALCFKAAIDDPARFKRSRSVGAYVGLTSRRHVSGEVDWSGRISKCGDAMLRMYLFEAAGVLLTRVQKWSALKAWGTRLVKRNGLRKAKVAVARKLAVILHRMWIEGTESNWSKKAIAA